MGRSSVKEPAANSVLGPAGLVPVKGADDVLCVDVPAGRIAYEVTGQGRLTSFLREHVDA